MNQSLLSALQGSSSFSKSDRAYDIPECAGIYVLLCTVTNKPYVGRSVNLKNRFKEHNKPDTRRYNGLKLAYAKEKYGQDSFLFYIIETCEENELFDREYFYIQQLDSVVNGYNSRHDSEEVKRWELTDSQKKKISDSLKDYYKSNENPWKGKTHSDESRKLIRKNLYDSDGHLKRHWSEDSRNKMRVHGKQNINYLIEWEKSNGHPRNTRVVMTDKRTGEEIATFISIKDALLFLEKPETFSGIANVLNERASSSCGFGWKYLNNEKKTI